MRLIASFLRALRIPAALLAIASASAADNNLVGRPIPNFDSGLQLSVTTSAFKVYGGSVVTPVVKSPATRDFPFPRTNLVASVMLANRSATDLTFTFDDTAAASRKFNFRVLNAAGEEVWNSSDAVAPTEVAPEPVTAILKRRTKWSSTLQIPVKVADEWLPPGVYTLEAAIAGEPKIGATTLFEVVLPPTPPPPPDPVAGTGIKGQVLRSAGIRVGLDGSIIAPTVLPMPVKAKLRIVELFPPGVQTIRAPFVYEGETAADGTFKVDTFPGRYRVTATALDGTVTTSLTTADSILPYPPYPPRPPQNSVSIETAVTAGAYTDVRLVLSGGVTYEPPAVDTGIRGKVTRALEGAVTPVAGATVVVEQLRIWEGEVAVASKDEALQIGIWPAFRWTGKTNASGEFSVNTPPGRFRITALVYSVTAGTTFPGSETTVTITEGTRIMMPNLRGTAEANVTAGGFTDVEVKVAPLLQPQPKVLIYSVRSAEAVLMRTTAGPVLRVNAAGSVTTGGWSLPELRQKGVTAEGVVEFEFLAKKPDGVVTQVISPVSASASVPLPANAKAVRVISTQNSKEVAIGGSIEPVPILQAF